MNYEIPDVRTMTDPEYFLAKDVDEEFIGPLMVAYGCIENAYSYVDLNTVDNEAQIEYALSEIDQILDLVHCIKQKLEGN